MKIFAVEGNRYWCDGGAMFGHAPKALWERWHSADELNRVELACRCMLCQMDDGRNILFDAGVGVCMDGKMCQRYSIDEEHVLLSNLAALGIGPDDIDVVVLSHLHFDHVLFVLLWRPLQGHTS